MVDPITFYGSSARATKSVWHEEIDGEVGVGMEGGGV